MRSIRNVAIVAATTFPAIAFGQPAYPVYQTGLVSRGHLNMWDSNAHISDAGPALAGKLTGLGVVPEVPNNGLPPFCINDHPTDNPSGYHELCISANALQSDGGALSYSALGGGNAAPLTFSSQGPLALTSVSHAINLATLPQTSAGDVPVCINAVTGQLYMGIIGPGTVFLTDDGDSRLLTDDSNSRYLVAGTGSGGCFRSVGAATLTTDNGATFLTTDDGSKFLTAQ